MTSTKKPTVDIGIITIRDDEFEAVLSRFGPTKVHSGQRQYNIAELETHSGRKYTIAILRCIEQGNGEAQDAARDLIEDLTPRWCLVVGIAGGVPSTEFTLGDVIVSTRVVDFSVEAALQDTATEYNVGGGPVDKSVATIAANLPALRQKLGDWGGEVSLGLARPTFNFQASQLYGDADWQKKVLGAIEPLSLPQSASRSPLVKSGQIASSDKLVKDTELIQVWLRAARQTVAVEMESAGLYRSTRNRIPALSIRGISDIIGLRRSPEWTTYACATAASFTHAFLRTEPLSLGNATEGTSERLPRVAEQHFKSALRNITAMGDTDVFPFPLEHHVYFDLPTQSLDLLNELHARYSEVFPTMPPVNESALVRIGYTGYRWVTQLDPAWNAYFLGLVIEIAADIERQRIPIAEQTVFSYRFDLNDTTGRLFRDDVGWIEFQARSAELASESEFVVKCDIADFYQRVSHERLGYALSECTANVDAVWRIRRFLAHFSSDEYGLPVGGPAARLLSEALLSRVDGLIRDRGLRFCRFADDYHFFVADNDAAHDAILFLTETLQINEGLTLQKLKTRILRRTEFLRSLGPAETDSDSEINQFFSLRLRYDPYSATAGDDFDRLREEVERFDIVGMLGRELSKSRVHEALVRRLLRAVRFLEEPSRSDTIRTLIDNLEVLSPVIPTVLVLVQQIFSEITDDTQQHVMRTLGELVKNNSPLMRIVVNLSYALRILANGHTQEHRSILSDVFSHHPSKLIRRDVILIFAQWKATYWLSNLKRSFGELKPWERRAFIVASYCLGDEGDRWRAEVEKSFDLIERLFSQWGKSRRERGTFEVRL